MKRLLIWRAGEVFREKLAALDGAWQVVRFAPPFRGVRGPDRLVDAAAPLPFADGAFDAVYARRVVEHLAPDEAARFARELRRVLAPGGVARLSAPDTEALAIAYLRAVDDASAEPSPSADALAAVDDRRLLLTDQFLRRVPGGALARRILSGQMPPAMVRAGFGDALGVDGVVAPAALPPIRPGLRQRAREFARLALGRRWVLETHASREADLWIWDRYSLRRLLREAGFATVEEVSADRSAIAGWAGWRLDLAARGPHDFEPSLVVEAAGTAGNVARAPDGGRHG